MNIYQHKSVTLVFSIIRISCKHAEESQYSGWDIRTPKARTPSAVLLELDNDESHFPEGLLVETALLTFEEGLSYVSVVNVSTSVVYLLPRITRSTLLS